MTKQTAHVIDIRPYRMRKAGEALEALWFKETGEARTADSIVQQVAAEAGFMAIPNHISPDLIEIFTKDAQKARAEGDIQKAESIETMVDDLMECLQPENQRRYL